VHRPWDAAAFTTSVNEFERLAERTAWPVWFLENHDHSRVATRYAGEQGSGARRARLALMLVCALRGSPFIFQGEELGLPDAEIPEDRIVDVAGRDPERAPIPWRPPSQAGPGAGFTTGEPSLPIVADAERLAVESQERDAGSTLSFARDLFHFRTRTAALQAGQQRLVEAAPDVFCFVRELDERYLVALNFSSREVALGVGDRLGRGGVLELSTHPGRDHGALELGALVLEPDEGVIVRLG